MNKIHTSVRLKQLMAENNLKQVDILRMAKPICKQYNVRLEKNDISQYVSGKTEPGQYKLFVLAKALNVSETWLMGLDAPKEREETNSKDTDIYPCKLKDTSFYNKYLKLNKLGKEKAETYIDDLLVNPQYTVQDTSSLSELKLVAENKNSIPPIVDDITHT